MANTYETNEQTRLLSNGRRGSAQLGAELHHGDDASSIVNSHVSKDEQLLADTAIGERLPYNDYTTIDWLHDLVKDSFRYRSIHSQRGLRGALFSAFDSAQGWIAAALIGLLTACVAFLVDIAVATVSDWKLGYCRTNIFASRENCCTERSPFVLSTRIYERSRFSSRDGSDVGEDCGHWTPWTSNGWAAFGIYIGFAVAFGIISSSLTMLTRKNLPATAPGTGHKGSANASMHEGEVGEETNGNGSMEESSMPKPMGKVMYMAAGSGIPEIKTILSGFVIPHFLDLKVLVVKALGAVFAVSTGMCLGKEGPFVHISTCVSYLVSKLFPKYRDNGRKMREVLSAGCASGLSVAFGAPIGGVLFSYEEISTYFPRKVLWRAFLCSLVAAITLKALNPTGTGKLVLFETSYGTSYQPVHYLVFVLLGVAGGLFGGVFCKANFMWSKSFRKYSIIKNHPVFEVFLVVLATALLQFPNPLTREPGDIIIKQLLVDCRSPDSSKQWVCQQEGHASPESTYLGWLVYGTLVKLLLTIITFGCKVPSGIIIPALDAGALFGRLIGLLVISNSSLSPGIFAMVGAAAFLAGVSRMTISLGVIMFELTGELEYIVPHMIAILIAKWVADALEKESVYDLAQTVLGHPFLDLDNSVKRVQHQNIGYLAEELIPPTQTMKEITLHVPVSGRVNRTTLQERLNLLKRRGIMDAGLVLTDSNGMLRGYLSESELEFGLSDLGTDFEPDCNVILFAPRSQDPLDEDGFDIDGMMDLSGFVDRTPLTVNAKAPMEYVVEMIGKLGLRYLCVVEEGSGRVVGVIIKKRLVVWLESLGH